MSVKSAFAFALNAARVLFVVFLLYVLALATFSYVFDAGIDGVFNDVATCVAFGLFYFGYAVGAFLTFWLPGALSKSFKYHVGDVWPFIAFFVHPIPSFLFAYLVSFPFHRWLS